MLNCITKLHGFLQLYSFFFNLTISRYFSTTSVNKNKNNTSVTIISFKNIVMIYEFISSQIWCSINSFHHKFEFPIKHYGFSLIYPSYMRFQMESNHSNNFTKNNFTSILKSQQCSKPQRRAPYLWRLNVKVLTVML